MYSLIYSPAAQKDLQKLPADVAKRIHASLKEIKPDPYAHVKKLKGSPATPLYSLHVGHYRAVLTIENNKMIIFVIETGMMREASCPV